MHTWTLIRQRRQCSIVVSFNFATGLEPFLKWHVIENGMNFRTTVHITDRVSLFDVCPITNIMYSSWNWDQQQHLSDIFPLQSSSSSIFELILDDAKNGRILVYLPNKWLLLLFLLHKCLWIIRATHIIPVCIGT